MSSDSRQGEIGEPHPFCVCKPHKTYCDHGKVTPECTKQSQPSFDWSRGHAFRKWAVEYWRKAKP